MTAVQIQAVALAFSRQPVGALPYREVEDWVRDWGHSHECPLSRDEVDRYSLALWQASNGEVA